MFLTKRKEKQASVDMSVKEKQAIIGVSEGAFE